MFTLVRDGTVLMGNNEDFVKPGYVWFVPAADGRLGSANFGFKNRFVQGSMNEKGLCFDAAEALFQEYNCKHLAHSHFMLADASGASMVVEWLPDSGLNIVRREGDYQLITNTRLAESGFWEPLGWRGRLKDELGPHNRLQGETSSAGPMLYLALR